MDAMSQRCKQLGSCPFHRKSNGLVDLICPFSASCRNAEFEQYVETRTIANGEPLFRAGDKFKGIYILQAGTFKQILESCAESQIVDFRYPGDVLGISAFCRGRYPYTAQALEQSHVCYINTPSLEVMLPHREIIAAISQRLRHVQLASVMLRQQNAEQRVIHFIFDVALSLGFNLKHKIRLRLPMSRKDIANYLGLVVETVSRVLQRLQTEGLITAHGRTLELLDSQQLMRRLLFKPEPWLFPLE